MPRLAVKCATQFGHVLCSCCTAVGEMKSRQRGLYHSCKQCAGEELTAIV
jgi:hypothetical protein